MKLTVKITLDSETNQYKAGDVGFIDGYIRGVNNRAHAIVLIGKRFVVVPLTSLEIV